MEDCSDIKANQYKTTVLYRLYRQTIQPYTEYRIFRILMLLLAFRILLYVENFR